MHGLDVIFRLNTEQVEREFNHRFRAGDMEGAFDIARANQDVYTLEPDSENHHLYLDEGGEA